MPTVTKGATSCSTSSASTATIADPWRGPAGIDGGEQESDPDHEQRREEYLNRCELPGPFDEPERFTQRERREDEPRLFNL